MKAKTIDNSPHGWDTCIYDNEDCPMGYYVDDLPDKERADKYTNIFNLELSSHVAKETEKLQAEIDYIKREKLAIHLLIDEITDGDCLKQSKAKLSAEIKELKAELEKVDYAYKNIEKRYNNAVTQVDELKAEVERLKQTNTVEKMQDDIVNNLSDLENGYGRRKWAISEQTGIPNDILTVLLKRLKIAGKIELIMIWSESTGMPNGSGYCLTGNLHPVYHIPTPTNKVNNQ